MPEITVHVLLSLAVALLLAAVAIEDIITMEIADGFHLAILLCALGALAVEPGSLGARLAGALCVSLPMVAVAAVIPGGFGGGDVKLMFALGAYLKWQQTLLTAWFALLFGGVYALYLVHQGRGKEAFAFSPCLCAGAGLSLWLGEGIWAALFPG